LVPRKIKMDKKEQKSPHKKGFIRIGTIIAIVLVFVALRLFWGIDIGEVAEAVIRKANAFTYKLILEAQELFSLLTTKLKNFF